MSGNGKKVEYEAKVDDEAFGGRYDAKKTFENLEDTFKFLEKNKGIRSSNTVESDVADGAYETNLGSVTVIEDGKEVGRIVCSNGMPLEIDPYRKPADESVGKPAAGIIMAVETKVNMFEGIKGYVIGKLAEPKISKETAEAIGRDCKTGEYWLNEQSRDEKGNLSVKKMHLGQKMPEAAREAIFDYYDRLLSAEKKENDEGCHNEKMVAFYKERRDEFSLPEKPDDKPETDPDKGADGGDDKK